ncbi:hypothetical protein C3941_10590 [Kaistia algarum]|uniref:autotransporter domain-containing protein n=1 Tax=Kaistia algarum TaxID=2083279 RepID=UPI000CE74F6E|nr:autotransporter domain-containing protein [Kaistia algarum]MCX5514797.1 autotransporter domain-containing protein [Kaistia algarum]PPE79561.1 hypothetical protein C3941_10590 [Kaistia algarum]
MRGTLLSSTVLCGVLLLSPALFLLPAFAEGGNGASTSPISGGGAGGADSATATGDAGGGGTFAVTAGGGGGAGVAGGAGGKSGGASGAGSAGAIAAGGTGSDGGEGSTFAGNGSGGGGGGGGAHGQVLTTTTTDAGAIGGSGGRGGNGSPITGAPGGGGGGGGAAGWGVVVDGTGLTYTLTGTAEGGTGGAGGNGSGPQGVGGSGGTGGTGVFFSGSGTLVNSGTILGGAGGAGGTSANVAGAAGAGGTGVVGADLTIINAGAISGGLSGDGGTRANAITFTGGSNSLTLQEGWSLTGDLGVNAAGSSLTFKLDGIDADVSNNITGQGGVVVNVGPQVLTLSGVNSYSGGTTLTSGTLSVASKAALGDGVSLRFNAPVSGVTGLSGTASALSSAISTYASVPTAENAAALAAAQAGYRQAIDEGQASGELPTLQITGSVSLDPATDSAITIGYGQAGAIRLEGADAGLTLSGFQGSMFGSAIMVNPDSTLDLGVGEGQTQGYVFSENHASDGGSVLYNAAGTVSIASATFSDNSAGYAGGAIANYSVLALADSTFTGNSAGSGGAMAQVGTLLVERSSFAGNDVQSVGGAIAAFGGYTTVIASSFSGNSAGEQGGAISVEGAARPVVVSLVDSDFTGNSAGSAGGAIALLGGTLNLTVSDGSGSLFSGNMAGGQASAIHVGTGVLTFPQFIYTASTLNVDTGTGALLDMRDPMSGNADTVANTLTKTGDGTWALGGGNVLAVSGTGRTDFAISEGRLYLYAAGEVDNPTTDDEDAVVGVGTLQLDGAGSTFTVGADGTLVAGGANSVTTAGTITFEDGATLRGGNADTAMGGTDPTFKEKGGATSLTLAATGGITLEGALNVAALGATDSFTLAGGLGGADGAITKSGAGTVALTGASTYAGGTTIAAGTLALSGTGTLAATGAVALTGSSSVFDLSGADGGRTIGDLSGVAGSKVKLGSNGLAAGTANDTTFAGAFDGSGTLTKQGTGTLLLTGDSSGFAGATTVAAGTLRVGDGTSGALGGTLQVDAGATLRGSGTIGGATTIDGTLAAGNSPGTLTFQDDLTLGSGSTSLFELNAPGVTGGASNDLVRVDGTLTLGGTLDADVSSAGYYALFTYGSLASGSSFDATHVTGTGGVEMQNSVVGYGSGTDSAVTLLAAGTGQTVQFWDGSQLTGNGTVEGGTGTWNAATTNWTGAPGDAGLNAPWMGSVGVFMGTAGTVTVDGTQAFDTLQFKTDGYGLTGGTLAIAPAFGSFGTVATDAGVTTTIGSVIADGTGANGLRKVGGGTLVLSGVNTYSGGTEVSGGTLSVSADANLGQASDGILLAGGTLGTTASFDTARSVSVDGAGGFDVADGTQLALAGAITGTGTLNKLGAGTLALFGPSDFDWTLEAGRLAADISRFAGDVDISGGATFELTATATSGFDGTLSGTGMFEKQGVGTLVYGGSSGGFAGTTSVAAGWLAVTGTLGGTVEVLSGATLSGTGTIGALNAGAGSTVAPGNSTGALTVAGDATFGAGSTYQVELGGGQSDRLTVGGTATIVDGTTLNVEAQQPFSLGDHYTLLASNGLSGSFSTVAGDVGAISAFYAPVVVYDYAGGNVFLDVAQTRSFASAAATPNQANTASALNSLTLGDPLFDAIAWLQSDAEARSAFDQLSGDVHASAQSVFMEQSALIRGAVNDRLRAAQGGVGAPAGSVVSVVETAGGALAYAEDTPKSPLAANMGLSLNAVPAPVEKLALWTTGFGNWGSFDGSANAAGLSDSTGGFLIGADTLVGDAWRVGLAGGYSHTAFQASGSTASGNSDNWHAALYAGRSWDAFAVRGGLAYTWQDVSTSRSVAFPGFADYLTADYNADAFQAFGEIGNRIDTAFASFEPFANLAYVSLDTSDFAETGGVAALHSDGANMNTTFATLGLRMAKELTLGVHATTLRGTVGWRQSFGAITPAMSQAFPTSGAFIITGTPIAETAAVLEAGLDMRLGAESTLGIAYTGQFGDAVEQNGFNASLKVGF